MLALYLFLLDDESAQSFIEQIYQNCCSTMIGIAYSIVHDRNMAEDIVHEAFLRLIDHPFKTDAPDSPRTKAYIKTIVRNIAIDYCRKKKRQSEVSFDELEFAFEADLNIPNELETHEEKEIFCQLFCQLDQTDAEILMLRYSAGYSDREIADLLQISHGVVRVRLHRARKQLKQILIQGGYGDHGTILNSDAPTRV